ncbi:hypothetical protein [Vibrio barjaei]|uniref:hypothetical protein n=1 Tax=Vibrio barjaei TaxID=1676683 RepID=UPI002285027A|nr:hypothetical protein [Vibrio barjaei]MCY9870444.1 hypothetical protein [Vibrio barjaei]
MNLKSSRDELRAKYERGEKPFSPVLDNYRLYRDTEDWRSSLAVETLLEYILYLEQKIKSQPPIESQIAQMNHACCCNLSTTQNHQTPATRPDKD